MLNLILFVSMLFGNNQPAGGDSFSLQSGDIIFQESCSGDLGEAIKDVTTSGIEDYRLTHVGMVWVDEATDSIFVLEATHPRVSKTPLSDYLYPKGKCAPRSVVGRLKEHFRPLIPSAIEEGKKLIGKDYDDDFDLKNDKYYCSEFVYLVLLKANHEVPVFALNIMTFKSKENGEFSPNWVTHFQKLGIPIPEGEYGINPGAMSRQTDVIDIVHFY
jgi:hypothetical protein